MIITVLAWWALASVVAAVLFSLVATQAKKRARAAARSYTPVQESIGDADVREATSREFFALVDRNNPSTH